MSNKAQIYNYFWVTNISNMNVSLSDLGLTIPAYKSVNLLDKRHYNFNEEELISSSTNGSLFKKKSKVVVRKVPPVIENKKSIEVEREATIPSRLRSVVRIEEIYHEELELSDETFAQQMADLTDQKIL